MARLRKHIWTAVALALVVGVLSIAAYPSVPGVYAISVNGSYYVAGGEWPASPYGQCAGLAPGAASARPLLLMVGPLPRIPAELLARVLAETRVYAL